MNRFIPIGCQEIHFKKRRRSQFTDRRELPECVVSSEVNDDPPSGWNHCPAADVNISSTKVSSSVWIRLFVSFLDFYFACGGWNEVPTDPEGPQPRGLLVSADAGWVRCAAAHSGPLEKDSMKSKRCRIIFLWSPSSLCSHSSALSSVIMCGMCRAAERWPLLLLVLGQNPEPEPKPH